MHHFATKTSHLAANLVDQDEFYQGLGESESEQVESESRKMSRPNVPT